MQSLPLQTKQLQDHTSSLRLDWASATPCALADMMSDALRKDHTLHEPMELSLHYSDLDEKGLLSLKIEKSTVLEELGLDLLFRALRASIPEVCQPGPVEETALLRALEQARPSLEEKKKSSVIVESKPSCPPSHKYARLPKRKKRKIVYAPPS